MKEFKVYLAGGMTGLSYEDYTGWREYFINGFNDCLIDRKQPIFFNPADYYNFEQKNYRTEKEIMEFDLYNLRKSDIVVVNFNSPNSIGTAMELMLAKELHIPIIGITNQDDKEIHPWLIECTSRLCLSIEETIHYIDRFYLKK